MDDRELVRLQETELLFAAFDELTAWRLGERIRQAGVERQQRIVVDVRRFDRQLFFAALPGTTPDNAEWVRRKCNTVERFHRSSYGLGLDLAAQGRTLESKYGVSEREYAVHGGAFPITVAGTGVIGSVTVSGLPQREDHMLVVRSVCAELGRDAGRFELP